MIQRIQTIFLFLVVLAMGVTIGTELWNQSAGGEAGSSWSLTVFTLSNLDGKGEVIETSSKWYIAALAAFAGLLALISIFQYRNRTRQMLFNMINSLIMVVLVVVIFLTTNDINSSIQAEDGGKFELGFWSVLAAMVFNMLANRFIRKDEMLVRSVDRIR
jgi:glucan phosphoethanolaminetransferase (alkaline phosphatase superfamily)